LLLDKPLLVTGNPGTGKSDLAERIAWEFRLGPVLRFEAQSLSEAKDVFYQFDLVGRLAASRLRADRRLAGEQDDDPAHNETDPALFVELGALGKAILRAGLETAETDPKRRAWLEHLRDLAFPDGEARLARRSVVLIDEIDKASRDFSNDLLNGIERMEFRIRELDNFLVRAPRKELALNPIVIITSNQERDLPPPFLRRCAFYHIPDPDFTRMAKIIRARVFPDRPPDKELPALYRDLLKFFFPDEEPPARRQRQEPLQDYVYKPGMTEMIEASLALRRFGAAENADLAANLRFARQAASAIAKHGEDLNRLNQALDALEA
jgi:MoxR-like ATPase